VSSTVEAFPLFVPPLEGWKEAGKESVLKKIFFFLEKVKILLLGRYITEKNVLQHHQIITSDNVCCYSQPLF